MYKFELKTEELSDIKTLANASDVKVRLILLVEALEDYVCMMANGNKSSWKCATDQSPNEVYDSLKLQVHQSRCLLDQIS